MAARGMVTWFCGLKWEEVDGYEIQAFHFYIPSVCLILHMEKQIGYSVIFRQSHSSCVIGNRMQTHSSSQQCLLLHEYVNRFSYKYTCVSFLF